MTAALIASFDALEEVHGERIGAPLEEVKDVLRSLKTHLLSARAETPDALAWKVQRLARAVENDWHASEMATVAASIMRDLGGAA
ncbi:hypothetical protein [Hyphomicrobium sp.]|uniref:hypothetical protein n=1 Tax=Hyphomicrobium sp. TaxID=82 RepID=UPI002D76C258|nr:hypothetical protein [Hyphomicrobium sp.]HET6388581.1 hypothetical protein [Hyphomicrobium sp.]